jgi:hypothetical protein
MAVHIALIVLYTWMQMQFSDCNCNGRKLFPYVARTVYPENVCDQQKKCRKNINIKIKSKPIKQ